MSTIATKNRPEVNLIRNAGVCSESSFSVRNGYIHSRKTKTSLSNRERQFLSLAVKMAHTSEATKQHGCVIVKNGSVLALGVNKWRSREFFLDELSSYSQNATIHAEMDALSRTKNAEGAIVYIARLGNKGDLRYSRPCNDCFLKLKAAGVKSVVYTNDKTSSILDI